MTAVEKAQDILTLARSRQRSDRERLMLSLADLCEAGLPAGRRLDPAAENLVNALFLDLVVKAEHEIRRQLAERLASAEWAPRELITVLAADEIEIARPLIAQSPVLIEQDLIALLRSESVDHQIEVARRPAIGASIVEMILFQAEPAVLTALSHNETADISADGMARLVEASREIAALRSPLTRHPRLTAGLAEQLYAWVGEALRAAIVARFPVHAAALGQSVSESVSRLKASPRWDDMVFGQEDRRHMEQQLAQKLHAAGQLKPGYLIRSLREERLGLFIAALAELSGLDAHSVELCVEQDDPEFLALACAAAGVDRSAFSTILALVRQQSGGRAPLPSEAMRPALKAFAVQEPGLAAQTLRQALVLASAAI